MDIEWRAQPRFRNSPCILPILHAPRSRPDGIDPDLANFC